MTAQFAKFLMVGGTSTLLNFGLFTLLLAIGTPPLLSVALGYAASVVLTFWLSSSFVFVASPLGRARLVARFFGVYGFSLVGQLAVFWMLISAQVNPLVANALAIATVTVINFTMLRLFVFRSPRQV